MKFFVAFLALTLVATSSAEPPRRFNQNFRQRNFARQEAAPAEPSAPAATEAPANGGAPYPPSGWKPQGAAFTLPPRQTAPKDTYGPPPVSYGPPTNEYGPPEPATTEASGDGEFATEATTTEPEAENIRFNGRLRKGKPAKQVESVFKNTDRGLYYVYLPDGRLQRVVYMTSADLQNMAYTARLQYQDVDPVPAPIFSGVNGIPTPAQRLILQPKL